MRAPEALMRSTVRSIALSTVAFCLAGVCPLLRAHAEQGASPACPEVVTLCPDTVAVGQSITMTANVSGGDPEVTPTYNWTVSAGSISSGQGTANITIDTADVPGRSTITATVDVGGYSRECSTSSSCTVYLLEKPEPAEYDEYGVVPAKDEEERLDNFMVELLNDPTAQAYVFAYGGRASKPGDAQKAATRVKEYLVTKRGLDAARAFVTDAGFREEPTIELWLVPAGAIPPEATPTIKPSELKPVEPSKPEKSDRES
jgi:hypothetical protein